MTKYLREPLLHFFLLAGVVFALFAAFGEATEPVSANRLEVTQADVQALATGFEATWRRPPTDSELSALIDAQIEEEILVREALLLGLDRGDAVVRQRLALKMRFLLEAGADEAEPTDEDLHAILEKNRGRFERPALVSFDQVALDDNGKKADVLLAALRDGTDPVTLGRSSMLPPRMADANPRAVDGTFGRGFFERIAALPEDQWGGPVESGFGAHLVRVTARRPAAIPPLDEVRDALRQEWIAARAAELAQTRLNALRDRHDIVRPDASEVTR